MALRIEGFAIVSDDGMIADARGIMPDALKIDADQRFLSERLDAAALIVHGRNSHEGHPQSPERPRLVATRTIEAVVPVPGEPKALLWNPAGMTLEDAAERLGVVDGSVAVLGGTEVYELFLPRYDAFHLSRVPGLNLPGGRPVFRPVPADRPESVLAAAGLTAKGRRVLEAARDVTVSTFLR
jgi:dihydrofolate reductase